MSDRRGWRETVEPGIYRNHRVACPSTKDRKAGRRCGCPYQVNAPGRRAGGTRLVTVAGTISDARAQRRALLAAGRPETSEPMFEAGTLDEFSLLYFRAKAPTLSSETIRNRDDDYRLRISPSLGGLDLSEVTRARVEGWLADLIAAASSHRMVVQTVATLRVMLGTAVEWQALRDNPAAKLRLPAPATDEEQAVERVLDGAQLRALIAAAGSTRTETMLRAAGEAGLRRGEVAGLKWGDVDLSGRRLHVRRTVVEERRTATEPMRKVEKAPKGRRARRVAITQTYAERLADWYAEAVIEGGAPADGFVWPGTDGGAMNNRSLAQALERACDRAGLVEESREARKARAKKDGLKKVPRPRAIVSPHGLRHTAATLMFAAGVPLIVVSRQLGHQDPNITAKIYAHLLNDDELDRAAAAFDAPETTETLREALREG